MRIGTSYKQVRGLDRAWDAIVIGSGMGGLATAAALAKIGGKRVLVLERHYTAGGFTHTFRRPGYEWDVGVHYIGGVHRDGSTMRRLFDFVSDGQLQWASMGDVYDRMIIDDREYDFVAGREAFRDKMVGYFPDERDAIDEYIALLRETYNAARAYYAEKATPALVARVVGSWMRRSTMAHARRTTKEVLASLTDNEELIAVLTGQWGDYGLPPSQSSFFIHALVAGHYLGGAGYPVGGSSQIAATVVPVIEARGGMVITNAEVGSIRVERDRAVGVEMADGAVFDAPVVISNAGAINTFTYLLPEHARQADTLRDKIGGVQRSIGHLSLYVGLRGTSDALGLDKTNQWVFPSADHDGNHARFLADPDAPFPLAYLSFAAAKDPDFLRRFPGHATLEVVTMAPWDWFATWEGTSWKKRGDDYDALKQRFTDRLLRVVYERCPGTEGAVEIAELSTPLTTRSFANHGHGEIYGLAHTPDRFEQRWLKPRTPIPGLFLTGSDVATAGVGGALMGGLLAATTLEGPRVMQAAFRGA